MAPAEAAQPDLDETHNGRPVRAPAEVAEPDLDETHKWTASDGAGGGG